MHTEPTQGAASNERSKIRRNEVDIANSTSALANLYDIRRRVFHLVQRPRKPAKIVNGTRHGHRGYARAGRFPVRTNAQDAVGSGMFWACRQNSRTKAFSSMAFIGLPWPKNNTGIRGVSGPLNKEFKAFNFMLLMAAADQANDRINFRRCIISKIRDNQ